LFAPVPAPVPVPAAPPAQAVPPHASEQRPAESVWPRALADAFGPRSTPPSAPQQSAQPAAPARQASSADLLKLRGEIARLELLVKKLQTELQIERQYNQALELQIKTLTQIES
jgi:hypothetical protein